MARKYTLKYALEKLAVPVSTSLNRDMFVTYLAYLDGQIPASAIKCISRYDLIPDPVSDNEWMFGTWVTYRGQVTYTDSLRSLLSVNLSWNEASSIVRYTKELRNTDIRILESKPSILFAGLDTRHSKLHGNVPGCAAYKSIFDSKPLSSKSKQALDILNDYPPADIYRGAGYNPDSDTSYVYLYDEFTKNVLIINPREVVCSLYGQQ